MANQIPTAVADFETQLSTAVDATDTTFSISTGTDDDGNALPAGKYCFTVDNGKSNKEYLLGQLNGTDVTSVVSVSRQGVESGGAAESHRIGANVVITDFATIQRVADILRGSVALDGDNPIVYDAEPTLTDRKEVATVAYVLDNITGGTVSFDSQIISGQNAGEAVAAGDLVYFKTSDQEWYETDADTAATVNGVQLGIAQGTGTDGASITGGVQISGVYTTSGLTAGDTYYASNTAGEYTNSAGTTERVIGVALSTTKLLMIPVNPESPTSDMRDAMEGVSNAPSSTNKFVTDDDLGEDSFRSTQIVTFTANGTWTKDAGLKYVVVESVGGGGGGGRGDPDSGSGTEFGSAGGGGGGYCRELILASALGATETVTVGAGGTGQLSTGTAGTAGGDTTFGSHHTAGGGAGVVTNSIGGLGGVGADADVNTTGGDGDQGNSTDAGGTKGSGGSSVLGGGGRGNSSTGYAGNVYGGGGGGGGTSSGGGAGAAGIVIVTEYYV